MPSLKELRREAKRERRISEVLSEKKKLRREIRSSRFRRTKFGKGIRIAGTGAVLAGRGAKVIGGGLANIAGSLADEGERLQASRDATRNRLRVRGKRAIRTARARRPLLRDNRRRVARRPLLRDNRRRVARRVRAPSRRMAKRIRRNRRSAAMNIFGEDFF